MAKFKNKFGFKSLNKTRTDVSCPLVKEGSYSRETMASKAAAYFRQASMKCCLRVGWCADVIRRPALKQSLPSDLSALMDSIGMQR